MVDCSQIQYFLGANTPEGFHSLYGQLLRGEEAQGVYILKGGAGCGKSTLLRQLEREAQARGLETQQILCLEDPQSLDGLVIPALKIALVDGTAPHVVEPRFAGVVEHYVNVGSCYEKKALQQVREPLMEVSKRYKVHSLTLHPCLSAAGELRESMYSVVSSPSLTQRLEKRAQGILNREIKMKSPRVTGSVTQRFLSANTSEGRVALYHTATLQCKKAFVLWDNYGISHGLLLPLLTGAVGRGYDVVACLNPMCPSRLEHLLIPELSLCFLTSSSDLPFEQEGDRKIRLETMLDEGLLKEQRNRLRVYRKMYFALLDEIGSILGEMNEIHKELEDIYHPYVDFGKLSELTKLLGEEIFGDSGGFPLKN